MRTFSKLYWCCLVASLLLPGAANLQAATYNLRTGVVTKTMPDGAVITMWGYANDTTAGPGNGQIVVPGPLLVVPPGDSVLTINLRNGLTQAATNIPGGVATSIVIQGQEVEPVPVFFTDSKGRQRARSFTKQTPPGGLTTYSWNIEPGSYLYHSGSHPAVQVQMGLYGAAKKDFASGFAYPGVDYANEAFLIYSEIDPGLHQAVAANTYGTGSYKSTLNYDPRYFLVNGKAFTGNPLNPGTQLALNHPPVTNEKLLVRLYNAGLKTHSAAFNNLRLSVVAEDGNPYSYAKDQYSVFLPALKTSDAVLVTPGDRQAIFDRAMHLTNGPANTPGGMVVYLDSGGGPGGAPVAIQDSYSVNEDVLLTVPAPGVLANDFTQGGALSAVLQQTTTHGVLNLLGNGSFTYQPSPNFNGSDSFQYKANDGTQDSNTTTAVISVRAVNDPPVAVNDSFSMAQGQTLTVPAPGVLGNDIDVDSVGRTASLVTGPQNGALTLNSDGSFSYTPLSTFFGVVTFSYTASDGPSTSNTAQVTITVNERPNTPPVANNNSYVVNQGQTLIVTAPGVLGNDTDAEFDPLTATLVTPPPNGTFTLNPDGSFSYKPVSTFSGVTSFSYTATDTYSTSNTAQVTVTVNPTANVPPVAVNDSAATIRNRPIVISVLANDRDPDGALNPSTVVITTRPKKGVATANIDGTVSYAPPKDWLGTATFNYTVRDDRAATSNIATVTVTVTR